MTSRMVGSVLTLVILLSSVVGGAAQTYTQMQWGMNKGVTPYAFGANINGTWRDLGTVSAAGVWGIPASNILFTQAGLGAIQQTVDAKLKQSVSIKDFGAKCDSVTDDTAAIQAALNSSSQVYVPSMPGYCKISGTLTMPTGVTLWSQTAGINYNAAANCFIKDNAGDMFQLTGGNNTFTGVCFSHTGSSGRVINDNGLKLGNNTIYLSGVSATSATNNEPVIYLDSSNNRISTSQISNSRPTAGSWAIYLDSTTTTRIANRIDHNIFVAQSHPNAGNNVFVGSSGASYRQEGTMIDDNQFISQSIQIWLQGCLSCHINNNELDQGWDFLVVIAPGALGVSNVRFTGNWISTPNRQNTGIAVHSIDTGYGAGNLIFEANDFAFTAYGDDFGPNISDVTFSNNNYVAIGGAGISFNGSVGKNIITGNKFSFTAPGTNNLSIIDGAGGGQFVVDNNAFEAGAGQVLTMTNRSNFTLGSTNANQTFGALKFLLQGSSTGVTTIESANAGATNYTATLPANTGTIAETNLAQTFTAIQTFSAPIKLATYTIGGTLPTCDAGALGNFATVSNGTDYATGTYGSAVSATGIVTRSVLCTNTAGATTYAWAYN